MTVESVLLCALLLASIARIASSLTVPPMAGSCVLLTASTAYWKVIMLLAAL
jgi:hypothetical protein